VRSLPDKGLWHSNNRNNGASCGTLAPDFPNDAGSALYRLRKSCETTDIKEQCTFSTSLVNQRAKYLFQILELNSDHSLFKCDIFSCMHDRSLWQTKHTL
jgi:hypothetical protein